MRVGTYHRQPMRAKRISACHAWHVLSIPHVMCRTSLGSAPAPRGWECVMQVGKWVFWQMPGPPLPCR